MAKPRVHFYNRFFYPDESATSLMLAGIAFGLVAEGYNVYVATSRQRYENAAADLPAQETVRGVTIRRLRTTRFGRRGLAGRSLDYASFYAAAAWDVLTTVKAGDIVVAKTDPPLLSVVIGPAARLKGARYVNWVQDVFPEVASAVNLGGRWSRLLFAALRSLRNGSLRLAHRNVAIGDLMAEHLWRNGARASSLVTITNWADPDVVRPTDPKHLRAEWELDGRIVVGYSGNLGRAHEVTTLVDAITRIETLAEIDANAARLGFVFIGGGAMRQALTEAVRARGLKSVRFQPYQPLERLAETLAVPDIHLVSLLPDLEGLIVPSKIYGILAAGRPAIFIGSEKGEVARLLSSHDIGRTVTVGDSAALASAILELAGNAPLRATMGKMAREVFEAEFTREKAVDRWTYVLQDIQKPISTPQA